MKKVIDGVTVEMEHRRKAADLRKLSELVQTFSLEIFREFVSSIMSQPKTWKIKGFFSRNNPWSLSLTHFLKK